MTDPFLTTIKFVPANAYVEAQIVPLTDSMAQAMVADWWSDPELQVSPEVEPIDRYWTWRDTEIERYGTAGHL